MSRLFVSVCRNLFEHVAYIQEKTAGMLVVPQGDSLIVDSGLASDTFNKVLCHEQLILDPERSEEFCSLLNTSAEHFAKERNNTLVSHENVFFDQNKDNRSFSLWTGTEYSENEERICAAFEMRGFTKVDEEVAMFLPFSDKSAEESERYSELSIIPVDSPRLLTIFSNILAANWTPPDPDVSRFFQRGSDVLLKEQSLMRLFLALVGDKPVCCGELFLSEGSTVAGIHMVSTLADWREKEIGSAMTTALLMAGRQAGASLAVLLASDAGYSVYSRQGFQPCGRFFEFSFMEENIVY